MGVGEQTLSENKRSKYTNSNKLFKKEDKRSPTRRKGNGCEHTRLTASASSVSIETERIRRQMSG